MSTIIISLFLFFQCCTDIKDVKKALLTGEGDTVIEAAQWIVENNVQDTSLVIPLITHILDTEISLSLSNYGNTPYKARVEALESITGEKCPFILNDKEDALIVEHYLQWALNKNLIKSKDDIDVVPPNIYSILSSEQFIKNIKNNDKVTWLKKYKWERKPLGNKLHH